MHETVAVNLSSDWIARAHSCDYRPAEGNSLRLVK